MRKKLIIFGLLLVGWPILGMDCPDDGPPPLPQAVRRMQRYQLINPHKILNRVFQNDDGCVTSIGVDVRLQFVDDAGHVIREPNLPLRIAHKSLLGIWPKDGVLDGESICNRPSIERSTNQAGELVFGADVQVASGCLPNGAPLCPNQVKSEINSGEIIDYSRAIDVSFCVRVRTDNAEELEAIGGNPRWFVICTGGWDQWTNPPALGLTSGGTGGCPGMAHSVSVSGLPQVTERPCCGILQPDFDGDGDVDQSDFGHWQKCVSGPNDPPLATDNPCVCADFTADGWVNAEDFTVFRRCATRAAVAADSACLFSP